ncbi:GTP-sensing pleiotropic transcriptional regulator CodY [Tissierella praeacuta]|uniref:Global transcriptional regulator CodY n=1 Tax=Tissierella praeacuta DSM 18095 TaxID=1123404 RepID=A0A1M4SMD4_9FIRM|nr:GTP-sensing pleiotropic transcriptional regulator CodY [Tissierella praeacuta]TCU70598.1 transcriptional pleiotropic repressor [Tissierella praeacuta]SHE33366.1 transcriptional pleiotropic repressor [Tissierella praeacuta DSM 18095]SUP01571.1 Vegetative protein 286B [Tissierella praeacuta]HAE91999.1 GTP-sensing pleiotropic transcriptional regulator CodY [Tissierella sp.]
MESLLQRTRKLNKTLQGYGSKPVSFSDLSEILSDMLEANVYIASTSGKVLGYELSTGFDCDIIQAEIVKEKRFPKKYNEELLRYSETNENLREITDCVFDQVSECPYPDKIATIIPINSGGRRLGTLVLARFGKEFTEEDLVLAEYSATIVGMEILRAKSEEIEEEARKKSIVQMAIGTLSYSELEAMEHIFSELDGNEGLLVASKIADRVGITRSVIVNALRKFESAGVIESRSLGMKGTHIRILNDKLTEELLKPKE